ncbi:MAG: endopeptidase La [Deltaproteobacteria bacterium]|jgi:ATP-dependent Lon protease
MKPNRDFHVPRHLPQRLPVLPLRQGFLYPQVVSPFAVARSVSLRALENAVDGWIVVAVQREPVADPNPSDLLPIGILARVVRPPAVNGDRQIVAIQGVERVRLSEVDGPKPYFEARIERLGAKWPEGVEGDALESALHEAVSSVVEVASANLPVQELLDKVTDPSVLVDLIAYVVDADMPWKQDILLTVDPLVRAEKVLAQVERAKELADAQKKIRDRVRSTLGDQEREVMLRRQLEAIRAELGEGAEDDEVKPLKERIDAMALSEEAKNAVDREVSRMSRLQRGSAERNVAIDWLNWIADLPWGKTSESGIDLGVLEKTLDETHFGLEDVKRQVLEHLAVKKLAGTGRADVLLLVGPPGVGKTSIAEAIAEATDKKLVRVALGGVRDEAELRGHRRTYVGARPGRLVEGLRRAGASDPVVLLDEVDKMGRGWQGDPAAALLEILDPEQNHAFVDHYLEVPFDLSKVLFIATANDLSAVPAPLRDRMEILEIEGYTQDEKLNIAKAHVLTKLAKNAGLDRADVELDDAVLEAAIDGWTREAGVRQLQRVLAKIFRAAAVKKAKEDGELPLHVDVDNLEDYLGRKKFFREEHEVGLRPGISTGLAWSPLGGDVLYVEATAVPGTGKLVLTGQLGDVMKESAQAALTYTRSHAEELGIDDALFTSRDIHVHVPAGATPKDGPSAGVTMFTAIASLFSDRPVAPDLAMTGEVTLRGRVLPVGGIKSKVLAAHARGIRRVILPERNRRDAEEIPERVRDDMQFVFVTQMDEVLAAALETAPAGPVFSANPEPEPMHA